MSNLNDTPSAGALTAADFAHRRVEPQRCTADACLQGRIPCPCPQACCAADVDSDADGGSGLPGPAMALAMLTGAIAAVAAALWLALLLP